MSEAFKNSSFTDTGHTLRVLIVILLHHANAWEQFSLSSRKQHFRHVCTVIKGLSSNYTSPIFHLHCCTAVVKVHTYLAILILAVHIGNAFWIAGIVSRPYGTSVRIWCSLINRMTDSSHPYSPPFMIIFVSGSKLSCSITVSLPAFPIVPYSASFGQL